MLGELVHLLSELVDLLGWLGVLASGGLSISDGLLIVVLREGSSRAAARFWLIMMIGACRPASYDSNRLSAMYG